MACVSENKILDINEDNGNEMKMMAYEGRKSNGSECYGSPSQ